MPSWKRWRSSGMGLGSSTALMRMEYAVMFCWYWCFGLMSGWRRAISLNIVMNVTFGRAAARILLKELGLERPRGEHVGDDGSNILCHPVVGPVILELHGKPEQTCFRCWAWWHICKAAGNPRFWEWWEHSSIAPCCRHLQSKTWGLHSIKVSNEQKPGCLVDLLGWNTTQLYRDYFTNQYKDPY